MESIKKYLIKELDKAYTSEDYYEIQQMLNEIDEMINEQDEMVFELYQIKKQEEQEVLALKLIGIAMMAIVVGTIIKEIGWIFEM